MKKKIFLKVFVLVLLVGLVGIKYFPTAAVSLSVDKAPERFGEQVRQEILASPARETTFFVSMDAEGDKAIEAQFRLEKMLAMLHKQGLLSEYRSYYGENIIQITGGLAVLRLLEGWPEIGQVSPDLVRDGGELQTLSTSDSEINTGTGQIIGTVTADDGITALEGIKVTAYLQTGSTEWSSVAIVNTGVDGTYLISGLSTGIYRVKFEDPTGEHVIEFYDNKSSWSLATNFDVVDGEITSNIDGSLTPAGKISGTITLVAGGTEEGLVASAWSDASGSWQVIAYGISDADGHYTIEGLSTGNYRIRFTDSSQYVPARYVPEWYDNVLNREDAQDVAVTAGITTTNINAELGSYGSIAGNVKAYDGTTNLADIYVDVYYFDIGSSSWEWFGYDTTDTSGNFEVFGLDSQDYRVSFTDPYGQFETEFYDDQPDLASADNVAVTLGYQTPGINAQLDLILDVVNIDLTSGWNLISSPLILSDPSPSAVFSSVSGNYGDVFAYDGCDTADPWEWFNPGIPGNDLTAVSHQLGYWVDMTSADILSLSGEHPLETTINLCQGWNLIGYPSVVTQPIETALSSIAGHYSLVKQYKASDFDDPWKVYNPSAPADLSDLKEMVPGYGYWIYITTETATLVIPGR